MTERPFGGRLRRPLRRRSSEGHRRRHLVPTAIVALTLTVVVPRRGSSYGQPRDDAPWLPQGADQLPPSVARAIHESPYAFFRLANRAWASRVCNDFAGDLKSLDPVRLHGDAHVEQYAVTDTSYGLDDFDDTAVGPAVIDLVRFLGSLRLAARERGWTRQFDRFATVFLRGYQRGL